MEHVAIKRADLDGILKLSSRIRNDLDALQEELEIISDNELAGKIEEGLTDIEEGAQEQEQMNAEFTNNQTIVEMTRSQNKTS